MTKLKSLVSESELDVKMQREMDMVVSDFQSKLKDARIRSVERDGNIIRIVTHNKGISAIGVTWVANRHKMHAAEIWLDGNHLIVEFEK